MSYTTFKIYKYYLFKLYVLLGTPDTNLSGLKTRKARSAFTSNPLIILMAL